VRREISRKKNVSEGIHEKKVLGFGLWSWSLVLGSWFLVLCAPGPGLKQLSLIRRPRTKNQVQSTKT
jgi:hypothetical protein